MAGNTGVIITPDQAAQERARRIIEHDAHIDNTERDDAEKAIVKAIADLARKYNALEALSNLSDITIPQLMGLVAQYNVTESDLAATMTAIQIQVYQLEAVTGLVWAECWDHLKSVFKDLVPVVLQA